ncbi:NUDIX domain-containing protein [Streptomyces zagrosensis]|uniref:ADP-ribose pyrophosphatase YjhB (NUDIX family) n=1 Tax=Streptomyces zagrosensis TaxID=1042984 RepID=A0A7W9QEJ3_9ACTN|nr:NUDIX domain-containing protein [Streptomyces zagrosensis]MBB5938795.1 ADP-ribose pyrophosphatase YjhB (NUDIX family) [Streptomyces zagrosensis]
MLHSNIDPHNPPARRLGCVALLVDAQERILLVKPTYKPHWQLPGGAAHKGEEISQAVQREVLEETGIIRKFTHYVAADQVMASKTSAEGINFVAVADELTADEIVNLAVPAAASKEISDIRMVSRDDMGDLVIPGQERRIRAAFRTLQAGLLSPFLVEGKPADGIPHWISTI